MNTETANGAAFPGMRVLQVTRLLRPLVMLAVLGAVGCSSKVSGSFEATGGALGTWSFTPSRCDSGQHEGFFGVYLKKGDSDSHLIKIVKDPTTGAMVVGVKIPGSERMLVLRKCKVLRAHVSRTNTTINDIRALEGSVELDCPDAHFKGKATFKMCH